MPGTVLLFTNMKIHRSSFGCQQERRKVAEPALECASFCTLS